MTPIQIINAALKGEGKKKQVNKAQMSEALGAVAKWYFRGCRRKKIVYIGKPNAKFIDAVFYFWGKRLVEKEERAKGKKCRKK